jgi:hypothetical protein
VVTVAILPSTLSGLFGSNTIAATILSLIPEFYPLAVNLLFFVYIKPYRDFVIEQFRRCVSECVFADI